MTETLKQPTVDPFAVATEALLRKGASLNVKSDKGSRHFELAGGLLVRVSDHPANEKTAAWMQRREVAEVRIDREGWYAELLGLIGEPLPKPRVAEVRAKWLAERRLGLGGSDAAAAVGLSKWKTPLQLYLEKIGETIDEDENAAMYRGRVLEPSVRQWYCDETGRTVETPRSIIRHAQHPFMLASLDGIASGEIIVDFKTARNRAGWGDPGTDEVPLEYLIQVQHYMAVAGMVRAELAVLFGDFEFSIYPVDADPELQALLVEREAEFWNMVQGRTPPEISTPDDVRRRWPLACKDALQGDEHDALLACDLAGIKAAIKHLEGLETLTKSQLQARIADHDGLEVAGELFATWKNTKSGTKFDAKRFQADHPELYAQYVFDTPPQRRLLLKEPTKCETTNLTTILPNLLTTLPAAETVAALD